MIIERLFNFFSSTDIFSIFFKAFAVVFSALYFLYAVVSFQNVKVLLSIIKINKGQVFVLISIIQIIMAFILLFFSIFIT